MKRNNTKLARREDVQPRSTEPLDLIRTAIETNADPEKMKSLVELYERLELGKAKKAYTAAMAKARHLMPAIVKTGWNDQTKSTFGKFEEINELVMPPLTANGFTVDYTQVETLNKREGWFGMKCTLSHEAGYSKEARMDFPPDTLGPKGSPNKTEMHGLGSSITYARRYLLVMALNLTLKGEDNDGNSQDGELNPEQLEKLNTLYDEIFKMTDTEKEFYAWWEKKKKWGGFDDIKTIKQSQFAKISRELERIRDLMAKKASKS
jgi:hypothetical protein